MSTRAATSSATSPWMRALRAVAVLAATSLLAASAAAAATPPALHWKTCGEAGVPRQCATLRVPLDWSRPHGSQVKLALTRRPAADRAHRIGSVLFNCGGPGCPTAQLLRGEPAARPPVPPADLPSQRLSKRFDFVGFDPRGTGNSTPIRCRLPASDPTIPLWPTVSADFRRLADFNRRLAADCRRRTGPYLMHLGSVDVIRDMEAIRAALRDGKLNWLGLSYGTMLGALYAERYPHRIRTMALDGALDRALSQPGMLGDEATTAEDVFGRWATWCESNPTPCPFRPLDGGQDVLKAFDELVASANHSPIPAPGYTPVTGQVIQRIAGETLVFKKRNALGAGGWLVLGPALAAAQQGDASGFAQAFAGDLDYADRAIACLEFPDQVHSFSEFNGVMEFGRTVAPHLGGATETGRDMSVCYGWPKPKRDPRHFLRIHGAPPTLIVNATHDPSTSYVWALNMHAQFPRSVLLTRDGDGHTSYTVSPCAQAAIDRYLITRRLPPRGTVCRD